MKLKPQNFFKLESASGSILFIAAIAAFVIDNSPFAGFYQSIFSPRVLFWINDGLMTLFFLVVGLELKREFIEGELAGLARAFLPGVAAFGGMIVPAGIYMVLNYQHPLAMRGWAIPMATDIAFALGILSLLGRRVPLSLKLFLMALAIFDDVGAIIIIVIFYTASIAPLSLLAALGAFASMVLLNFANVQRLILYLLLGVILWFFLLKAGIHPTVAGVLLACVIPLTSKKKGHRPPLRRLEHVLHPWVAYGVIPFFAFANAGVSFSGLNGTSLLNPISLGIILGLFIGKQVGVFSFSWLAIKTGWATLPAGSTWLSLYGVAVLCGIGFTMSLFIGSLAFEIVSPDYLNQVRLAVMVGSLISGIIGAVILRYIPRFRA
jgi:Na+:H+ antiporter, NhaA family